MKQSRVIALSKGKALCLLFLLCLLPNLKLNAQDSTKIELEFKVTCRSNDEHKIHACIIENEKDLIQVDVLRFYISRLELWKGSEVVWKESNSFHLLDVFDLKKSLASIVVLNANEFDAISFQLGIDSATNVSGAMGGDLDPTKGMYWTWQSGYINYKIEGKYRTEEGVEKSFQFHIGGYQYPNAAVQTITLRGLKTGRNQVLIDLSWYFHDVDLKKLDHIMSPSLNAVEHASRMAASFSLGKQ